MSVSNGSFNMFGGNANGYIYDNSFNKFGKSDEEYNSSLFPGWNFITSNLTTSYIVLSNGSSAFGTNQGSGKQCLVVQQNGSNPSASASLHVIQSITFSKGYYTLSFNAKRRSNQPNQKLSVNILNKNATPSTTTPLTTTLVDKLDTNWQTFSYNFSIGNQGIFILKFLYEDAGDSDASIFLTDVQIVTDPTITTTPAPIITTTRPPMLTTTPAQIITTTRPPMITIPNDTTPSATNPVDYVGLLRTAAAFIESQPTPEPTLSQQTKQPFVTMGSSSYNSVFSNNIVASSITNPISDYYNLRQFRPNQ